MDRPKKPFWLIIGILLVIFTIILFVDRARVPGVILFFVTIFAFVMYYFDNKEEKNVRRKSK